MREIKAYIRDHMLDDVIDALAAIPELPGIAVAHLHEYGHASDDGRLIHVDIAKLEVYVPETLVASVVETIVANARTGDGHPGDGKVFVSELADAVRIADGQSDEAMRTDGGSHDRA